MSGARPRRGPGTTRRQVASDPPWLGSISRGAHGDGRRKRVPGDPSAGRPAQPAAAGGCWLGGRSRSAALRETQSFGVGGGAVYTRARSRRGGVWRCAALLHYALEVPDQTVGEKFYTGFGLVDEGRRRRRRAPAAGARSSATPCSSMRGPKKRLHHLAFGAPGAEFQATLESIRRAGVRRSTRRAARPRAGVWVRDPDGNARQRPRRGGGETPPADPPLALNSPGPRRPGWRRAACPEGLEAPSAPAGPHPALHPGARSAARLLHARARAEALRSLRRHHRVPALLDRPSQPGPAEVRRARLPPRLVRGRQRRRDRDGRAAHAGERAAARLGPRAAT